MRPLCIQRNHIQPAVQFPVRQSLLDPTSKYAGLLNSLNSIRKSTFIIRLTRICQHLFITKLFMSGRDRPSLLHKFLPDVFGHVCVDEKLQRFRDIYFTARFLF